MIKFFPSKIILQSKNYMAAKEICEKFSEKNLNAYMVGGCVRDFYLFPKQTVKDIDIATDASVENIKSVFPKSVVVGNSFGVCLVKHQHFTFEVATFRKDGPYLDRRHPSEVTTGTLEDDSKRRDFTINAIYFSPLTNKIIDLHGGLLDLKKKQLKCVGNADERIYEDALRILRCLRFSANLNFSIEKKLISSLKKNREGLKLISIERVLDEISKVKNLSVFAELFYTYVDVSVFFKSLKKRLKTSLDSKLLLQNTSAKSKSFQFSGKAQFFNFFVQLLLYYKIDNFYNFQKELKHFVCANYDKKLCVWFVSLLQPQEHEFCFFKKLLEIERIESNPNPIIFEILKKHLKNRSLSILINAYNRTKASFSQKEIIANLQTQKIPPAEYSSIILRNRFNLVKDK